MRAREWIYALQSPYRHVQLEVELFQQQFYHLASYHNLRTMATQPGSLAALAVRVQPLLVKPG
jgi:hypothetical protein